MSQRPGTDPGEARKQLYGGLRELVTKTYELEETVKNYVPESQELLVNGLNDFIGKLLEVKSLTHAVKDVRLPRDLLEYVDNGGNPHQYTAEAFQACVRDNQIAKGKVQAVQSMYDALLAELQEHRPEVANAYKSLLSEAGAAKPQGPG